MKSILKIYYKFIDYLLYLIYFKFTYNHKKKTALREAMERHPANYTSSISPVYPRPRKKHRT